MAFDASNYGAGVAALLALDGGGQRLMPLAQGTCSSAAARERMRAAQARQWFAAARAPEAAMAGLWLYFSCLDEAHAVAQEVNTPEGSFWHGILHRQEPDPGNAAYWFRQVGRHPVYAALREAASPAAENCGLRLAPDWDPLAFIDVCERVRRLPGSDAERAAMEIQRLEWQLLFDYSAR